MPVASHRLSSRSVASLGQLFGRTLRAAALGAALMQCAQAQSLQELYDASRGYDATYLAARAQAESAAYRAAQVDALMRPSVGLTAALARQQTNPPIGANYGGNARSVGINATQPLFNPANSASIAQAQRSLDSAAAALELAEQDLIVRITQAYFNVLGAQDTLATTRTNKAAIAEQLASAKRNFEVGTATITDTREAQARFDLATAQEIAADNDLLTKRIALDQLVGRPNVSPKQLAVPVVLPAVPYTVEEWATRANTGHPSVRQAEVALDVAKLETDKARAGNLPTVDAVASYSTAHGNTQGIVGNNTTGSIGVQLNYPLFAGFSTQNRIKETLVLEDKSRNDLEAARRGVTQSTRQVYYSVLSLAAQVKALEAAESSSQLALEATQLGYKVGVRVNLDVLNAQTQLFTTQRDLAKARYDVLVGNLLLRQAAGTLTSDDLAAISNLLAR